jgi:hypothetical protein
MDGSLVKPAHRLLSKKRNDQMKQKIATWQKRAFVFAFLVLTLFCWCPVGYGSYGQVGRFFGIPSWAVLAFCFAAALFTLEWIYLFWTRMAMNDEELPGIVSQLESVNSENPLPAEEGK